MIVRENKTDILYCLLLYFFLIYFTLVPLYFAQCCIVSVAPLACTIAMDRQSLYRDVIFWNLNNGWIIALCVFVHVLVIYTL
jgi:hypothetical protein